MIDMKQGCTVIDDVIVDQDAGHCVADCSAYSLTGFTVASGAEAASLDEHLVSVEFFRIICNMFRYVRPIFTPYSRIPDQGSVQHGAHRAARTSAPL